MILIESFESLQLTYKTLDPESDNFDNYLKWLRDVDSNKFIHGVSSDMQIDELFEYVHDKNKKNDCLLLGIFFKESNCHIGNIKLEPISFKDSLAWLGILLGEPSYRGQGLGLEILNAVMDFAHTNLSINIFKLGVDARNIPAIQLYKKVGFTTEGSLESLNLMMTLSKNK